MASASAASPALRVPSPASSSASLPTRSSSLKKVMLGKVIEEAALCRKVPVKTTLIQRCPMQQPGDKTRGHGDSSSLNRAPKEAHQETREAFIDETDHPVPRLLRRPFSPLRRRFPLHQPGLHAADGGREAEGLYAPARMGAAQRHIAKPALGGDRKRGRAVLLASGR